MQKVNSFCSSPLNYTGGKYKLLPQILPHFPADIGTFVDLFCGGANVGVNVRCKKVLFNDVDKRLISLLQMFKETDYYTIIAAVAAIIEKYGFSVVSQNGYDFYGCKSDKGLGEVNKEPFLKLRADFNAKRNITFDYLIEFYVLIIFSFNNQIRFNSRGEFNLPVGKRDFNVSMQQKMKFFVEKLHFTSCEFSCNDFRFMNFDSLTSSDFVYCDPPYLITCATYNEQGGWSGIEELRLLQTLDKLNKRNVRFALSNVLQSKGKTNTILTDWLSQNPEYQCVHLDYSYSNSNYQTKGRTTQTDEVLIKNY